MQAWVPSKVPTQGFNLLQIKSKLVAKNLDPEFAIVGLGFRV
jgi:hypothetical protein